MKLFSNPRQKCTWNGKMYVPFLIQAKNQVFEIVFKNPHQNLAFNKNFENQRLKVGVRFFLLPT